MIHVHMGAGQYAPCSALVSSPDFNAPLQSSCGDDFAKVTCPVCKALVARMARHYRKATRGKVKWSEDPRKNVR